MSASRPPSASNPLLHSGAVQLLASPQVSRVTRVPLPLPKSLWSTFLGAIAIGSTAAAVGAYYITLTVVFPEGSLPTFFAILGGCVALSVGAMVATHHRLTHHLTAWIKQPGDSVDLDAWRQALNYPELMSTSIGVAALLVCVLAAGLTSALVGGHLVLHVIVGGTLAAVLDALFAWMFIEHRMRRVLRAMAARDPMLPVGGSGIIGIGIGTKMAIVIVGVSVVGAVVAGTLAYRGAEAAVAGGGLEGLALRIFAVTVIGLLVSLSGCLLVARQATVTLEELTEMLSDLSPESYSQRALPCDGDETGHLMSAVNRMLDGLEEREFIKDAFSRYVTRQVSDVVLQGGLDLGGEMRHVTILMTDIRGFTTMSENMSPRTVVKLLNRYFTAMVEACMEHDGLIDKFIGDAIMVVFGAPARTEPAVSALKAARAALAMTERLEGLNRELISEGLTPLKTGIGIHSGEAIAGNIGSPQRLNYTVIGDAVNIAARIETASKELACDLLISEATRELLGPRAVVGTGEVVQLKGKSMPTRVFPLLGLRDDIASGHEAAS